MKKTLQRRKTVYQKHRICRFCSDRAAQISYKDYNTLRYFITERGKIIPRRISGNCAKHQRRITRAIKRARVISILPFTARSV